MYYFESALFEMAGKPLRTLFHITSYSLFDKNQKEVTRGNNYFTSMNLESKDKLSKDSRKSSSKIVSTIVKACQSDVVIQKIIRTGGAEVQDFSPLFYFLFRYSYPIRQYRHFSYRNILSLIVSKLGCRRHWKLSFRIVPTCG